MSSLCVLFCFAEQKGALDFFMIVPGGYVFSCAFLTSVGDFSSLIKWKRLSVYTLGKTRSTLRFSVPKVRSRDDPRLPLSALGVSTFGGTEKEQCLQHLLAVLERVPLL